MALANCCWPLAAFTFLPLMGAARAQTSAQVEHDPMGVLYKLKTGMDPKTAALRRRIKAGPADLLRLFAGVQENETRRVAQEEITQAAAVVLAARAKPGAFSAVLPALSVDPSTSKPLLFRREGADGFIVYSAGPQGDYNGGKPGERVIPGQSGFRYPVPKTPAPVEAAH